MLKVIGLNIIYLIIILLCNHINIEYFGYWSDWYANIDCIYCMYDGSGSM